jgi:hypothetical protein
MRRRSSIPLAASSLALLALRSAADLPPQYLPVLGGSGGTAYTRDCGPGRVLTGFRWRSGLVVDAVGIMCRPVLADGTLGPETTVGTLTGGSGGTTSFGSCSSGRVLTRLVVYYGSYVAAVAGFCNTWQPGARTFAADAAHQNTGPEANWGASGFPNTMQDEHCESAHQPGSGIRGRSGAFVDAIGLVCDEP